MVIQGVNRTDEDVRRTVDMLTLSNGEFMLFYPEQTEEGKTVLRPLPIAASLIGWWAVHANSVHALLCYRRDSLWLMPSGDRIKEVHSDLGGFALHIKREDTMVTDTEIIVRTARVTILPPETKISDKRIWTNTGRVVINLINNTIQIAFE